MSNLLLMYIIAHLNYCQKISNDLLIKMHISHSTFGCDLELNNRHIYMSHTSLHNENTHAVIWLEQPFGIYLSTVLIQRQ